MLLSSGARKQGVERRADTLFNPPSSLENLNRLRPASCPTGNGNGDCAIGRRGNRVAGGIVELNYRFIFGERNELKGRSGRDGHSGGISGRLGHDRRGGSNRV